MNRQYIEGIKLLHTLKRIDDQDNELPDSYLSKLNIGGLTEADVFKVLTSAGFDWANGGWELINSSKYIKMKSTYLKSGDSPHLDFP